MGDYTETHRDRRRSVATPDLRVLAALTIISLALQIVIIRSSAMAAGVAFCLAALLISMVIYRYLSTSLSVFFDSVMGKS